MLGWVVPIGSGFIPLLDSGIVGFIRDVIHVITRASMTIPRCPQSGAAGPGIAQGVIVAAERSIIHPMNPVTMDQN